MANVKISALPTTGVSTPDDYFVIDDAALTTTSKIQLKNFVGLINPGVGTNNMVSAPFLTTNPAGLASGSNSIALGNNVTGFSTNESVLIGKDISAYSANQIMIGQTITDSSSGRDFGVGIGLANQLNGSSAVAIGVGCNVQQNAVGIGRQASPIGTECIAIGQQSVAAGNSGIAIGDGSFSDRFGSVALGKSAYVDGEGDVSIGYNSRTDSNQPYKVAIGYSNTVNTAQKQIAIGYDNTSQSEGGIIISNDATSIGTESAWTTILGGSGNTFASQIGFGNVLLGGFNHNYPYPVRRSGMIGGTGCTLNASAGVVENVWGIGLKGRSIPAGMTDTTLVENFVNYGTYLSSYDTYSATTINLDITSQDHFNILATNSGGTYNISVNPVYDGNIGREMTLYIEYQDGATINFTTFSTSVWKWDGNFGGTPPTFSATTGNISRTILKFASWDGDDWFEVSRSVNME